LTTPNSFYRDGNYKGPISGEFTFYFLNLFNIEIYKLIL